MTTEFPAKAKRIILFLGLLQLAAGLFFLFAWMWGLKAPGALAGGAVTLALPQLIRRGILSPRATVRVAVVITVLGLASPWPWVRYVEEELVLQADWHEATAPPNCECIGITVRHPQLLDVGSESTTWYFCNPDMQRLRERLPADGRVETTWEVGTARPLLGEPRPTGYGPLDIGGLGWPELGGIMECERPIDH